jgi:DNA-binding transcriptional ArsR family regulator
MAKRKTDNKAYWILDQRQLECLASAPRAEILDWLCSSGPQSVSDLASALNRKPSSLYHHIELMMQVGLVEEAGTRTVYRRTEKLYATPSRRMRLKRALADGDHDDLMEQTVASMTKQFRKDFSAGLDDEHARRTGQFRDLGFYRFVGRPSREGLKAINDHLDAIADILWTDQDPERPAVALGWVMAPLKR